MCRARRGCDNRQGDDPSADPRCPGVRHIVKEDSRASRFVHAPAAPDDREEPGRFEGESITVV
jgi:hypothetical protein